MYSRMLPLVALIVALYSVHASVCNYFSGEELFKRFEDHFKQCFSSQQTFHDRITERLLSNELTLLQHRQPLSLVFFSNDSTQLDMIATAFATALGGTHPSPSTVQVIDFQSLLQSPTQSSNHVIKQHLRHVLASSLRVCGHHRTLFILRHVELIQDKRLPLLDVFLDPLNGKRAQFYDPLQDRVFECQHSIFFFLFDNSKWKMDERIDWRVQLQSYWTTTMDVSGFENEVFTPQAMIGRLTDVITLEKGEKDGPRTKEWHEKCDINRLMSRLNVQQKEKETSEVDDSRSLVDRYRFLWDRSESSWLFIAFIPFLMLCNRITRWRVDIATPQKEHKGNEPERIRPPTVEVPPNTTTNETIAQSSIKKKTKTKPKTRQSTKRESQVPSVEVEQEISRPTRRTTRATRRLQLNNV